MRLIMDYRDRELNDHLDNGTRCNVIPCHDVESEEVEEFDKPVPPKRVTSTEGPSLVSQFDSVFGHLS
jgi:hypothetical protein